MVAATRTPATETPRDAGCDKRTRTTSDRGPGTMHGKLRARPRAGGWGCGCACGQPVGCARLVHVSREKGDSSCAAHIGHNMGRHAALQDGQQDVTMPRPLCCGVQPTSHRWQATCARGRAYRWRRRDRTSVRTVLFRLQAGAHGVGVARRCGHALPRGRRNCARAP